MKFLLKLYLLSIIFLVNASYTFIEKTKKNSLFDYSKIYKSLRYLQNSTEPSSTEASSTVTSSTETSSTIPSNANNSTELLAEKLLIGYDGYTRSSDEIKFFTYVRYFLIPADKFIYVLIRITKNLRNLEEETRNITCSLESIKEDIAKYECEENGVSGDISKVDAIGLYNEGEPITESYLSKIMGNNLQNQNGDKISDDGMIVLDSCRLSKDSNNNNIITCSIDSYLDSSLNNKNSTFHIIQNDEIIKDVPAQLTQDEMNVQIKLDPQYSINATLNNTIGRINNEGQNIYLIFNEGENSTLTYAPSESSTIPSSTETSSTIPTTTVPSNVYNTTELLPKALLIGYDGYIRSSEVIKFYTYIRYFLIQADKVIYVHIRITKNVRALEEETRNITCPLVSDKDNIAKYECEEDGVSGDISKVEIISLENQGVPITESYLSKIMGNNLQNQNGDKISDDGMIVLDSCRLSKDSNNNNIITCSIDSYLDSSLNNKDLTLHIIQNDGKVKDVTAQLTQDENNVQIKLDPQYSINANLNNTIGRINNGGKNIYLFFNEGENSTLTYGPSGVNSNRRKKISRGLSAGGIVAIIIPCILVLIAVAALAFFLGKKSPTASNENMADITLGINSSSNINK